MISWRGNLLNNIFKDGTTLAIKYIKYAFQKGDVIRNISQSSDFA